MLIHSNCATFLKFLFFNSVDQNCGSVGPEKQQINLEWPDEDYNDEDEVMCDGSDEVFYDFDKEEVPPQDLDSYPPVSLCEDREELLARLHEERVET